MCFSMNPAKQIWVNIKLVRLACCPVNDKFTPHIKLLILTENMQEIINSGYHLLKEVKLLHGNDGICSKISVNFHHFFLPLSNDYKQRFFYCLNICHLEKELRSLLLEIIERKKWNCTWKDKIIEPLFRVFNNGGLPRGFLWSLCRSFADTLVRSVWLGTNVTLELFLFLRKFVANCLR